MDEQCSSSARTEPEKCSVSQAQQVPGMNAVLSQIAELKNKNAWTHITALFHPVETKLKHLCADCRFHELLSEVAFALSQLHQFEDAIRSIQRCLELYPDHYRYLSALGFNYYNALMAEKSREIRLGDKRQHYIAMANDAFAQAEKMFPENVVDFYRHGMLYHHLSNTSDRKAVPLFLKAIDNWKQMNEEAQEARHKDRKNYIKALYHLAKSYIRLGDGEKAFDAIEECIREDEGSDYEEPVHKFYTAGKALLTAGDCTEAIKYLRVAANKKSSRPKDYIFEAIGRCCMHLKEYDQAAEWIERIPEKYRKPHMKRLYGSALGMLGKFDRARNQFREALRKDRQGRHKTLLSWGHLLMRRNEYAGALEKFEKANEERRKVYGDEYADALYYIGRCYAEQSNTEKAIEMFKKALSLDPRHANARQRLVLLQRGGAGMADQALQASDTNDNENIRVREMQQ